MTNSKFAILLRQCRENSGLTQKQVATALNVERSTYAYYETGSTRPSCDFVLKIAQILNVDYKIFMEAIADTKPVDEDVDECYSSIVRTDKIYNLSKEEQNLVLAYRTKKNEVEKLDGEING